MRTGVDLDGLTLAEDFQEGSDEHDPALLWYIDVRCEGDSLPSDVDAALDWFRQESDVFTSILHSVADELTAGVDSESLPYQKVFGDQLQDAVVRVAISAMRRMASRSVAGELHQIANRWHEALDAITASTRV